MEVKRTHMWHNELEEDLMTDFDTYINIEDIQFHLGAARFQILLKNIRTEFLSLVKCSIDVKTSIIPMVYKYKQALFRFMNALNKQLSYKMYTEGKIHYRINNITQQVRGYGSAALLVARRALIG